LGIPMGHCCSNLAGKPWIPWAPTVDGVELHAHPWQLLKEGKLNKVPVLHGTNRDEGAGFEPLPQNVSVHEFVKSFKSWYGPIMGQHNASEEAVNVYLKLEQHQDVPNVTGDWWSAERSEGDQAFACPARVTSRALAQHGFDVFQYFFTHAPSAYEYPVVFHGAEIPYVFMQTNNATTYEELQLAKEISSFWYKHAAYGNPNGKCNDLNVTWPRYERGQEVYLQLDVQRDGGVRPVDKSFRAESCSFMDEWLRREVRSTDFHASDLNAVLV